MQRQIVTIKNSTGLHARPAMLLVRTSNNFVSEISLYSKQNADTRADAKSISSLCALGVSSGMDIVVEASGSDEEEATAAIVAVLSSLND